MRCRPVPSSWMRRFEHATQDLRKEDESGCGLALEFRSRSYPSTCLSVWSEGEGAETRGRRVNSFDASRAERSVRRFTSLWRHSWRTRERANKRVRGCTLHIALGANFMHFPRVATSPEDREGFQTFCGRHYLLTSVGRKKGAKGEGGVF